MLAFACGLLRNLVAGLRVALFLPVRRLAFRIDLAALIALFVVSALVDVGADALRYGGNGIFSWYGLGNEVLSGGLLVLSAAILAIVHRDRELTLAIPVIALAAFPVLQIANAMPWQRLGVPGSMAAMVDLAVLAWIVAVLVRSVYVALEYRRPHRPLRAIAGGLLLASPILFAPLIAPVDPWFAPPSREAADARFPNPASEPVLAAQAVLLDEALAALEEGRRGVTDLYFVGFAGDATEDVFRKDIEAARKVMDERWGTSERSIALVNNPRTLLTAPMASLSNLRDALDEIAGAMDADEDVVMVYLATHGSAQHELTVRLPPLELVAITPRLLKAAFDDAGIRYRIVVISACYAGGFINELAGDDTLVIVASQADRMSFGCGDASESTFFGEALFQQGMAKADSIAEAFAIARDRVAERERAEGIDVPSHPQIRTGTAIAAKLRDLNRRGGATQLQVRRPALPAV